MTPELSQVLMAVAAGAGGVSGWRLMQYIAGRWFDKMESNQGDDAKIRASQAKRISDLERQVEELQKQLQREIALRAALEAEVGLLRDWCGPKRPTPGG